MSDIARPRKYRLVRDAPRWIVQGEPLDDEFDPWITVGIFTGPAHAYAYIDEVTQRQRDLLEAWRGVPAYAMHRRSG